MEAAIYAGVAVAAKNIIWIIAALVVGLIRTFGAERVIMPPVRAHAIQPEETPFSWNDLSMAVSDQAFDAMRTRVFEIERQVAVQHESNENIERRLAKIETILSRLTWLMLVPIIGGMMAWVMGGGLHAFTGH